MGDIFEEHLSVIDALKENYARAESDDVRQVAAVNKIQEEIATMCSQREHQVKEAVKGLSQRNRATEKQATYPAPEDAHTLIMERLGSALAQAKENVDTTNSQLEDQRRELRGKAHGLEQTGERIEEIVTEAEPRTKHELSLYAHISKITWRFDKPDRVAGAVSDPASGDIRAFDFDPKKLSEFEIVNKLWDAMGHSDATPDA